ncbi:MAG: DegT/DnrJ/EryC1/StrS family aminotransferase [Candidatus Lindowbacteria bacterium]|nr:DegT/DnrJ/EryC1/StrS family aminotransferase [Candidatus Lindowbacteria bacterium]
MKNIPLAKPTFSGFECKDLEKVLESGWVTQGPKVAEFEAKFAEYVGAKHGVAVSSCTTALHLSLIVSGVQSGDVVITVSHSFIATANCIRHCGAEPVFVDIDPATNNIDIDALERCLREDCEEREGQLWFRQSESFQKTNSPLRFIQKPIGRVGAILLVHQLGVPCDLDRAMKLSNEFGVPVVEDAACACGSEFRSSSNDEFERIGRPRAPLACFSFHPRKVITMGDGGIVTTNSEQFAERIRLLRHHSMAVSDVERHSSSTVIFESYPETGYNYRLTDIQATIGIRQVEMLPEILKARRELAANYHEMLSGISWLDTFVVPENIFPNWQSYVVRINAEARYSQVEIMQKLLERGVATRRQCANSHDQPAYNEYSWSLPKSVEATNSGILLPLFVEMTSDEQEYVVQTLKEI